MFETFPVLCPLAAWATVQSSLELVPTLPSMLAKKGGWRRAWITRKISMISMSLRIDF